MRTYLKHYTSHAPLREVPVTYLKHYTSHAPLREVPVGEAGIGARDDRDADDVGIKLYKSGE